MNQFRPVPQFQPVWQTAEFREDLGFAIEKEHRWTITAAQNGFLIGRREVRWAATNPCNTWRKALPVEFQVIDPDTDEVLFDGRHAECFEFIAANAA